MVIIIWLLVIFNKSIATKSSGKSTLWKDIKNIWRFVRVRNFSPESSYDLLRQCELQPLSNNYDHLNQDYRRYSAKRIVGNGMNYFLSASEFVVNGTACNTLPWAKLVFDSTSGLRENATIATITQFHFLPLFSFNPCRVVHLEFNQSAQQYQKTLFEKLHSKLRFDESIERFSRLVYQTVEGHMLDGEESLYVNYHKNDTVTFQISSHAKISSRLIKPFEWSIRSLQRRFLFDLANLLPFSSRNKASIILSED